jgi:hypothetical protein
MPISLCLWRRVFTGGDHDHFFDKIKAGDHFGDRMFDLKAGIHFQKIEIAITINDKFDRTGTVIANRRGKPNRFGAHCLTGGIIQKRRRCFFDDFLVADAGSNIRVRSNGYNCQIYQARI